MTILVIRGDGRFSERLREAGYEVMNLELIATRPADDLSELRLKVSKLSEYDGVFFTSPAAAEIFISERTGSNGFRGKVFALGERARIVLENAGFDVIFKDAANTAHEMLASFDESEFAGKRFLFVRGNKSRRSVPDYLKNRASLDEVIVYETVPVKVSDETVADLKERLKRDEIDWVCFFSPSGVERFVELFGRGEFKSAAIGKTTAESARETRLNVHFISHISDAEVFANSLIEHIDDHR